ncbi:receptor protein kinase TMK1 [Sesamum indicum]|uniref:non-specific serine/threonine protein kinase n=1 Tax=Sesamum indicum TaxID=4182 RepID=A0A6I9U1E2_SESIN|nr:receptor protein kinase TMK1 [Sesamum indicum]XP_011090308.1 receptor protein kinase TMK1 [Sesamum indicum]XP_020552306.1 receptor protein kinase TMK1 [Sesamum indicum]
MGVDSGKFVRIVVGLFVCLVGGVSCVTDQNDFNILSDFRDGLENPELLKWPDEGNDPCGPPAWPHVFCSNGRVTQIQVQGLGLEGPLPQNLNQLDKLYNVGFQRNKFTGKLPTFSGLSNLEFAFLDFNEFDAIPTDFFHGLSNVRVLALDSNPFNQSSGWTIPTELAECSQLVNFSCSACNIVGTVPDFFGKLPSLASLELAYNRLTGNIPSTFQDSMLQMLWLNDQDGGGMTGPIDVIGTMVGLTMVWLHGNQFSGSIPDDIGRLTSLRELNLNRNRLVGLIPSSLADMKLDLLDLNNNMFMGPIPKFKAANVSYKSNSFCQLAPGEQCAPEVSALIDFLHGLNYPVRLASAWTGNDPCSGPWWGITCNSRNQVSVINLQKLGLNGTLSPSLVNLSSLLEIHLEGNNIHGTVPANLTQLRSLRLLNLSGNNFEPPLPRFRDGVRVVTDDNAKFQAKAPEQSPSPDAGPPLPPSPNDSPQSPPNDNRPSVDSKQPPADSPSSAINSSPHPTSAVNEQQNPTNSTKSRVMVIAAAAAGSTVFTLFAVFLTFYCIRKRKETKNPPSSIVIHPKDSPDPDNTVKIAVVDGSALEAQTGRGTMSDGLENGQVIEAGNLLISLQVLRKVTNNFAQENELGRGGFGVVYKGELEDGTKLAVKRMVVGAMSNKALDEFQSEIAVLSQVRHRHLVSLLGYSVEGNERLLVYEYMPQGALSRHLFRWKSLGLEPLSWTRRLNIALDVARGVEYLHTLAHQSFIHRDLKSSNILLDDDFRAKVSDFGLVKLAPDRERSVATRLAGTFGYLAPEYAVTGKVTTKVDVFSFGVVLMELLTGLVALDEQRPEENRYLAEWFWQIKSNKESLIASIDPALDAKEDIYETIYSIAALAGHCTARDPNHRPDMGHAVNALAQLVEKWKPYEETDEFSGINMALPLPQMLKGWQEEAETQDFSGTSQDSKGSIPAKPSGFADSFTSADAR